VAEEFKFPLDTDFDQDLSIDLFNLHGEWQVQAYLRHKYGKAFARAIYEERQVRKDRNRVKARIRLDVKDKPENYGLSKPTVDQINAAVDLNKEVIEAENELAEATYNVELLRSAVIAMGDKKDALREEVRLFTSSYYEDKGIPKVVRDMAKELIEREQIELIKESGVLDKKKEKDEAIIPPEKVKSESPRKRRGRNR